MQNTHNIPTQSLNNIKVVAFIAKADESAPSKAHAEHKRMTFCLPQVSHINPQKCELMTIPRNAIDDTKPCSVIDIFKSQFA